MKQKIPTTMVQQFGPLPSDEEMPERGAVSRGAHSLVENAGTKAESPRLWRELMEQVEENNQLFQLLAEQQQ